MPASFSLPLPVVRLRLTVRADGPLPLPPYGGSMLRGALGHALMELMPLPHASGQPCALRENCAYCQVFAPVPLAEHSLQKFSQMPAPYVIEPPFDAAHMTDAPRALRRGETFQFGLVLIGQALRHLPVLTLAFARACQRGLGTHHTRCTLMAVERETPAAPDSAPPLVPVWQPGQSAPTLPADAAALPAAPALPASASLHLQTPPRLQSNSRPAQAGEITARALLVTLARRCQLLMDTQLGPAAPQLDFSTLAAQAEAIRLETHALRWFKWGRYSNRQQQAMNLGGLLGTLRLHGDLAPFAPLLHHVGKETTFGLGRYGLTADGTAQTQPPTRP